MRHLGGACLAGLLLAMLGGCGQQAMMTERPEAPSGSPAVALAVAFEPVAAPGEPGAPFPVGSAGYASPFDAAAAKLSAAGLELTGQDRSAGVITGRSQSNDLVNCGTVVVSEGEEERRFAGNAPTAVVPVSGSPGTGADDFVVRGLAVETEFRVALAGATATVSESHRATLTLRDLASDRVSSSSQVAFTGAQRGRLNDGTVCASSGEVRRILQ